MNPVNMVQAILIDFKGSFRKSGGEVVPNVLIKDFFLRQELWRPLEVLRAYTWIRLDHPIIGKNV